MILDRLQRAHAQTDIKGKRRQPFVHSFGVPAAGIKVTPATSMTYTAVYAAVSILSGTAASLPLGVFKKLKTGDIEEAFDHPIHSMISEAPNPEMTSEVFWENVVCKQSLWGNGFAEIERAQSGKAVALWPIPADNVTLIRNEKTNDLVYEIRIGEGKTVGLFPRDMFHVPMLGDGLIGFSPILLARQSISAGLAMEQHAGSLFGQGAMPGGVLKITGELSDEGHDRLARTFDSAYRGSQNAGRTVILEEGAEFEPLTMSSDDAQFLETRKFQIDDIARIFRVPPHMLAQMADATFSNIEHQGRSFERFSMRLLLRKITAEIKRKLLGGSGSQFFAKFDVDDLLEGDSEARSKLNKVGRETGVLSVNDIRRKDGLNSIGPEGDVRIVPMNFTSLKFLKDNPGGVQKAGPASDSARALPAKTSPTPYEILYPMARDIAGRLWHKGSTAVARMAKKKSGEPLFQEVQKWAWKSFRADMNKAMKAFIATRNSVNCEQLALDKECARLEVFVFRAVNDVYYDSGIDAFDSYIRDYGFESPEDITTAILQGVRDGT